MSFKWDASGNTNGASLVGYNIYANDAYTANVLGNVLTYTLTTGVTAGTAYKIQISTLNAIGEGAKSPSSVFYAVDVPPAPTLVLSDVQIDSCTITWTSVTPPTNTIITGYIVLYDSLNGLGYNTACDYSSNPSQTSCKISYLSSGKKIAIKANAYNKGGKSLDSSILYCIPVGKPGQPGTPRLVLSSSSSIQLQWDGVTDTGGLPITSYNLYYDEEEVSPLASVENWVLAYTGIALTATHTTGLSAGKNYRYRVQASNSVNVGVFSNVASFVAGSVPSTPTSFTVSSSSRTWMVLSWGKPTLTALTDPPVLGYVITSDFGNKPSYTTLVNLTNGDQLAYNLTGQSTGALFNFKISAYNLVGKSSDSTVVSGTFADPPGKMSTPYYIASTKTSVTVGTITVGWYPVSDTGGIPITGYKLYMIDTVTLSGGVAYDGSNNPGTLLFANNALVLGRKYRFYVTALNPKEGIASDTVEFYAAGLPAKISSITEVANSRTETCIGLQWTAPDDGGSAIILYELSTDDGVIRYSGTTAQAYICNLVSGAKYAFRVQATSLAGKGTVSDFYNFIISGIPAAPRYLRSTSGTTSTKVVLQWEIPSSIGGTALTGYKINRKLTNSASAYSVVATVDQSLLTYSDSTVSSGVSYTYVLSATNAIGESSYSSALTVVPMNVPGTPAAPTLLSKDRYSVRIAWSPPSDLGGGTIQGYKLYMKKQSDSDYSFIYTGTSNSYLAIGLSSGSTYYFKINARNEIGESAFSDPSAGIIVADKPSIPQSLRISSRSSGAITIKWDLPSDTGGVPLVGYTIERALGSGNYAEVAFAGNTNPGITYFADTGLTTCVYYSYRVYSINIDGRGAASSPITALSSDIPVASTTAPTISNLAKYSMTVTMPTISGANTGGCPITTYKIYTSINGNAFIEAGSTTSTSYTLTGLQLSAVCQIKYAGSNRVYDEGNNFGVALQTSPAVSVTVAVPPQTPENFRQGSIQYRDSIYFEWTMPSDTGGLPITAYTLEITDVAATTITTSAISASAISFTATSLIPGKTYTFRLQATTSSGSSAWTNYLTAVPGLLPISPAGLVISSKTRSSFTLAWTTLTAEDTGGTSSNPIIITSYQLSLRNTLTGIQSLYTTTGGTYTISYLTAGLYYGVKLKACTSIGCSSYGAEVQDIAGLAPGVPGTITLLSQSNNLISFSWLEAPDDGGSTVLYYQIGFQVDGVETIKTGVYATTYRFGTSEGIVAGKTYLIRISAINSIGAGAWTNQITAYSSNLPSTVSGLTATSITQTSAQINWVLLSTTAAKGYPITDPTYLLESALCLDDKYTQLYTTTTALSYTLIGISPGICMRFRMKVRNNLGDSSYCTVLEVTFATIPATPSSPTIISRTSNTIDGTSIKVGWVPPATDGGSKILGYLLEQSLGTTGVWTAVYDGSTNSATLSYTSQGLTAGQTYKFRISARNAIGFSLTSAELSAIAATVPGIVLNLRTGAKIVSGSSSQLTINWDLGTTGGSAITTYYVKKKTSTASSYDSPVSIASSAATYNFINLNAGVTYIVTCAASNLVYDSNNLEGLLLSYADPITVILANVPSKITTFTQITSSAINQVMLSWATPSDGGSSITGYVLSKDNGAGVFYELYRGTNLNYTDSAAIGGNSYNYQIFALNAVGNGPVSDTLACKAGLKPGIVKNLVITSQSSTSIVISWAAPDSNGGYAITKYWVMSDTGDMVYTAAIDNGVATTYTKAIIAAQIGLRFRFKIAAESGIGIGSYSSEVSAVAANPPDAPTITVNETSRTLTSVGIYWVLPVSNGGTPILGYIVRRDEGVTGSALSVVYNGATTPYVYSYILSSLITGKTYTVQLTSVNAVGESSSPSIKTIIIGTKPSQMSKVTVTASSNAGTISISWVAPASTGGSDITKYRLYIALASASFGAPIEYSTVSTLSYAFSGIFLSVLN